MTTLEKVRELLAELTPGEKAQTLQWLVRDLTSVFPGVESSPHVSVARLAWCARGFQSGCWSKPAGLAAARLRFCRHIRRCGPKT